MVKVNDLSLIECFNRLDDSQEGAIKFLKCLKEHKIIVYWSDTWSRLVPKSEKGVRRGSWRSVMKTVTKILEIKSKDGWIQLKKKHGL